jgi:diguanylate cyclase (GGDEF)-like protein
MKKRDLTFVLLLEVLLLAGFLATSLFSYFSARASLRHQISESQLPLTSDNIYSEIQRDLLRPILIASFMASDVFLREWTTEGEKDPQKVERYLAEVQQKYQTITSFFVSEPSHKYYHSNGILKVVNPEEPRDSWYFRVQKMKEDFEVNLDPDLANRDAMTIFINHRVYDNQNQFIGATGVGLTVHSVAELIRKYERLYGRQIYFTDTLGNLKLQSGHQDSSFHSLREMPGLAQIADSLLGKRQAYFQVQRGSHLVHFNSRYIPEFHWFLVVEQDESMELAVLFRTLLTNLIITFLVSLFVLALTWRVLKMYRSQFEKMAITDQLTGAHNRHAFAPLFHQIQQMSTREEKSFALLLLDIDHFKTINDKYGHQCGDAVIATAVRRIRSALRAADPVFRWGGEEFLILLPGCSLAEAELTASKVLAACSAGPIHHDGIEIPLTLSGGLVEFLPTEERDALVHRADLALYRAKQSGRNHLELG